MTNREFYNAILSKSDVLSEELVEFAREAVIKLDGRNEKQRIKNEEKRVERENSRDPIRKALLETLIAKKEAMSASDLIANANLSETIKPAQIPSLLKPYIESDVVSKIDMKVDGGRRIRGYVAK